MACVKFMSEDEVQDMMEANEFVEEEFEDEDEEDYDDSFPLSLEYDEGE
jgi:hypothetical protein